MKMKKIVVTLLLFTLTFFTMNQLLANTEGDVDGTFTTSGYNNPVVLQNDSIEIYNVNNSTDPASGILTTSLSPTQEYYMSFVVSDLDGFENIELDISLIYVEGATIDTTEEEVITAFDSFATTAPEKLSIQWSATYVDSVFSSETFTLNDIVDSDTSWELSPQIDIDSTLYDLTSSSTALSDVVREYTVYFKTSKVAPYSNAGEWYALVKVIDTEVEGNTETTYFMNDGYNVEYYGEINMTSATSPSWEGIYPKMNYDDVEAQATVTNVGVLSNSNYDVLVKSSEVWEKEFGLIDNQSVLTANPTEENTFSIVATTEAVWSDDLRSAGTLNHLGMRPIIENQSRTQEVYDSVSFYLYLKLSPQFQNGTYTGKIFIGITNSVT